MKNNLKNKHYGHIMLDGGIYSLTSYNPHHDQPCKLCGLEDVCKNMPLLTNLCDMFEAEKNEYFKMTGIMVDEYTIRPL